MTDQRADYERTIQKARDFDELFLAIETIMNDLESRGSTPLSFNRRVAGRLKEALVPFRSCKHFGKKEAGTIKPRLEVAILKHRINGLKADLQLLSLNMLDNVPDSAPGDLLGAGKLAQVFDDSQALKELILEHFPKPEGGKDD